MRHLLAHELAGARRLADPGRVRVVAHRGERLRMKNGAKDLVLAAIRQGISDRRAIETMTGLNRSQVENAIKRLKDDGEIIRKHTGGYAAVTPDCLLAEVWH
jgi:biotin operon repressor